MYLAVEKISQLTFASCPVFVCLSKRQAVHFHSLPVYFLLTLIHSLHGSLRVNRSKREREKERERKRESRANTLTDDGADFIFAKQFFLHALFILKGHHASVCIFESCRTDARKKNKGRLFWWQKLIHRERACRWKNICLNVENAFCVLYSFFYTELHPAIDVSLCLFPYACFPSILYPREALLCDKSSSLCQIFPRLVLSLSLCFSLFYHLFPSSLCQD